MPSPSHNSDPTLEDAATVKSAIDSAIIHYFDACRQRVKPFIRQHFHYPGAWYTNKSALGWDLLRAPFNLFWAPVYVSVQLIAWLLGMAGLDTLSRRLGKLPGGFTTTVQQKVAQLIATDLLLLNSASAGGLKQALLQEFDDLVEPKVNNRALMAKLDPLTEQALNQYGLTRTASADITNSILSTAVGAFAFQKFTPGGLAIGLLLASWFAQKMAIENFFLGELFGGVYYGLFPAQPSTSLSITTTVMVLECLAILASLSGIITDPIQSWTGMHRYRLHKMLKHLQKDMLNRSNNSFSPKDPYVARILEILDAAKSQII